MRRLRASVVLIGVLALGLAWGVMGGGLQAARDEASAPGGSNGTDSNGLPICTGPLGKALVCVTVCRDDEDTESYAVPAVCPNGEAAPECPPHSIDASHHGCDCSRTSRYYEAIGEYTCLPSFSGTPTWAIILFNCIIVSCCLLVVAARAHKYCREKRARKREAAIVGRTLSTDEVGLFERGSRNLARSDDSSSLSSDPAPILPPWERRVVGRLSQQQMAPMEVVELSDRSSGSASTSSTMSETLRAAAAAPGGVIPDATRADRAATLSGDGDDYDSTATGLTVTVESLAISFPGGAFSLGSPTPTETPNGSASTGEASMSAGSGHASV